MWHGAGARILQMSLLRDQTQFLASGVSGLEPGSISWYF